MIFNPQFKRPLAAAAALLVMGLAASPVAAHCDSLGGPVVADARSALSAGKIDQVLKWIGPDDEAAIRDAFELTLAVRRESETAMHLADRYFFETLVRIHRATEGEAFTGLKAAGSVDPAIAAADRALESGQGNIIADEIAAGVRAGVQERFAAAYAARQTADQSAADGRAYVQAYVQFTHFVETASRLAESGASHQHASDDPQSHR